MQPDWKGFRIRLGRAIDRWPGGGQKAFAEELAKRAERQSLNIPTSYRTIVNYLNGFTTPSVAWVEAAAEVLRWNPENLLTGKGPERPGEDLSGLSVSVSGETAPRWSLLVRLIVNTYVDLPMGARMLMLHFVSDYYADDFHGWGTDDLYVRRAEVEGLVAKFFGPLLSRPRMHDFETMALTSSLASAAYLRLHADYPNQEDSNDEA